MARTIESEIQLSAPLNSLPRELILNVFRTDLSLTAVLERVLRPAELRLDEYNVLRIVRGAGDAGHARADIEERMVHGSDRLLAILHRLKSRGLVEGALRVAITPAGEALLAGSDPAFHDAIRDAVSGIPEHKLRTTIEVLETLRARARPGGA